MQYRNLGRTGLLVSPICLGTMHFGGPTNETEARVILSRALEEGINFIDTANAYTEGESERIIGRFLKEAGRRAAIVLATKVYARVGPGPNEAGVSRHHILQACEDSLRRLQTDHIDLYQQHRPSLTIPQDETLRAYDDLVRAGKVRYIGSSTFPAWMVMEALAISERYGLARFSSDQSPYNLLDRRVENELIPLCQKHGLAVLPWSPLGGGILAGRYSEPSAVSKGSSALRLGTAFTDRLTRRAMEVTTGVATMAQERGLTASQLALLWLKDQPGVTAPVIGPRTLAHLDEALTVLGKTLGDAERPSFDSLVHPGTAVADFFNGSGWMKARIRD